MNGLFSERWKILRAPQTVSASGEVSLPAESSWTVVYRHVPGLVQPRSGNARQQEYGKTLAANFRGFCDPQWTIREGDRVINESTGARFEVTFVANQMAHHLELDLATVTAP